MIKEKLQNTMGEEGKPADWFVLVFYEGKEKEYQYSACNIKRINEAQVRDFSIVHKSVIFPPKMKKEETKMTTKLTKDEIRVALEKKGVVLSNSEFKKTVHAKLLEKLQEAVAKSMASGIKPVINRLREIARAGGKVTRDEHKVFYKLAKNAAAKQFNIVIDKEQYVVGASDKDAGFVRIFLLDEIGILRVYKNKKPVWKRMTVSRVEDSILYHHKYNGMEEGRVVDAGGTVKFQWDRSRYNLPAVRTEDDKPVPVATRKEEQLRIKAIIEEVYPSQVDEVDAPVAPVVKEEVVEDLPFDING